MRVLIFAFMLFLAAAPTLAQEPAPETQREQILNAIKQSRDTGRLIQLAARARQESKPELQRAVLQRLKQLLPYNREVALELAQFHVSQQETQAAFNELVLIQGQGLYANLDELKGTDEISDYQLWSYLKELFAEAKKPFGQGEIQMQLPPSAGSQPSAIVRHDDATFLATIDTGKVWRQKGGEEPELFIDPANVELLHAITGMAVDKKRNRLWIASAGLPQFSELPAKLAGVTALFSFELTSGELIKRYPVANDGQRHQLADIEVDKNGLVYAADQATPILFRLDPSDETPKAIGGSNQLSSLRAIALSKNQQTLYVADYALGLFGIQLGTDEAFPIAAPQEVNLGGIEDLEAVDDGQLLAVQPGVLPQRVMLIDLAENRREVTGSVPLAASLPEFNYPLRAEVVGEDAWVVSNSQLDRVAGKKTNALVLKIGLEPPESGQRMRMNIAK